MFKRYVAIGDSTTEGLDDPDGEGGYRGWADRLAERLAALEPGFRYANLAVRGWTARRIRHEQLPRALELRPDLATVVAGMNDLLRPNFQFETFRADLMAMFGELRLAGATVLTFTLPDLTQVASVARPLRGRLHSMNAMIRDVAHRTGTRVADLAAHPVAADPRLWSDDRLHANSLGHARVAEALADALQLPGADARWTEPLPEPPPHTFADWLTAEVAWSRRHLAPWVWRHLRGRSSGDERVPKRPDLLPFRPDLAATTARGARARGSTEG